MTTLRTHDDLLEALREMEALIERGKTPGVFYRGSRPFLHFHGDGDTRRADLKRGDEWAQFPAVTAADRRALLRTVETFLSR